MCRPMPSPHRRATRRCPCASFCRPVFCHVWPIQVVAFSAAYLSLPPNPPLRPLGHVWPIFGAVSWPRVARPAPRLSDQPGHVWPQPNCPYHRYHQDSDRHLFVPNQWPPKSARERRPRSQPVPRSRPCASRRLLRARIRAVHVAAFWLLRVVNIRFGRVCVESGALWSRE